MRPPERPLWWAAATLSVLYAVAATGPKLCVVTDLTSGPFASWRADPVPSLGCRSRLVTPRGQEVHAIRLRGKRHDSPRQKVELNVLAPTDGRSYSPDIVLVLDSSYPVNWVIRSPSEFRDGTSFQIIVTQRSQVLRCDLQPYTLKSQRTRDREDLIDLIRSRLQAITSFTDVTAADTIDFTVGIDTSVPDTCDTEAGLTSRTGVDPHTWKSVQLEGCFHKHLIGLGPRDVYVVEVTGNGARHDSRVRVNLLSSHKKPVAANVTLILRSTLPLRWELAGGSFTGDLLVLTEDAVQNVSLAAKSSLNVQRTRLPDTFTALVLYAVQFSSGPPVAYLRMPGVSRLDINLDGAPVSSDADDLTFEQGSPLPASEQSWNTLEHPWAWTESDPGWTAPHAGGYLTDTAGSLRSSVSVACSGGLLTVAVPASLAEDVAVRSLHFSDPSCSSHSNGTHLIVQSSVKRCGTEQRPGRAGNTVYFNTVYFVSSSTPLDDEDFEGSGGGYMDDLGNGDLYSTSGGSVPITCAPVGDEHHQAEEAWRDIDEVDESVYGLELATDFQFRSRIQPNLIVPVSHSIYLRPTIEMGSYLQPVLERCWVGSSSDSASPPALLLVDSGCAALPSVSMIRSNHAAGVVFKLQVTEDFEYLGPYYLHCRMGVCAGPTSPARQVVAQCAADPTARCLEGGGLGEKLASGLQTITRGPLLSTETGDGTVAAGRRPLLQWGVSPATVAAIGVSAFLLGVALMAGIWLIHTKIGPSKRHHFQPVPQSVAGEPAVAPSTNSTPNSQTPIIVPGRPAAVV